MIRKLKSGEYRLYSRKINAQTGKRRNLGTFRTRPTSRTTRTRGAVLQAALNVKPVESVIEERLNGGNLPQSQSLLRAVRAQLPCGIHNAELVPSPFGTIPS